MGTITIDSLYFHTWYQSMHILQSEYHIKVLHSLVVYYIISRELQQIDTVSLRPSFVKTTGSTYFAGSIVMLWHGETHINHKGTYKLSWIKRGSNSVPPDWGNTASCQLSSTFVSCLINCVKKHNPNTLTQVALHNWQPVCAGVNFNARVC